MFKKREKKKKKKEKRSMSKGSQSKLWYDPTELLVKKLIRDFCWHFDRRRKHPEKVLVNADHKFHSTPFYFYA